VWQPSASKKEYEFSLFVQQKELHKRKIRRPACALTDPTRCMVELGPRGINTNLVEIKSTTNNVVVVAPVRTVLAADTLLSQAASSKKNE